MTDVVARLAADLRAARTDEGRQRGARRLRDFVRAEGRAGADTAFAAVLAAVYAHIATLVAAPDANDKLAGIFANVPAAQARPDFRPPNPASDGAWPRRRKIALEPQVASTCRLRLHTDGDQTCLLNTAEILSLAS